MSAPLPPDELTPDPRYYLHHFIKILDGVGQLYPWTRHEEGIGNFVRRFAKLPEEAQCLYIRLMNRRPLLFRRDKLRYAEIGELDAPIQALLAAGLIQQPVTIDDEDTLAQLLPLFTKAELIAACPPKTLPRSAGKTEWMATVLTTPALAAAVLPTFLASGIIERLNWLETDKLHYLYFGNLRENASEFVIQELGHVRIEGNDAPLTPRFQTAAEADDGFLAECMNRELWIHLENGDIDEAEAAVQYWFSAPRQLTAATRVRSDKLALRMAAALEKAKFPERALALYQHTEAPPSRERQARILLKLGDEEAAWSVISHLKQSPNVEEAAFARDMENRHQRQTKKAVTQSLAAAAELRLPRMGEKRIEDVACQYFASKGYEAWHTENEFWRSLFGLVTWELIAAAPRHHEHERSPDALFRPGFFEPAAFEAALEILDRPDALLQRARDKRGTMNALVFWHSDLEPQLAAVFDQTQSSSLKAILRIMVNDLRRNRRGFPDLLIHRDGQCRWIEIKGPNDSLSNQQLFWLEQLQAQGLEAEVIKVSWV